LVIELDGRIHDNRDQKEYDKIRQEIIEIRGIRVLRFKNKEVEQNVEKVLSKILELTSPP
jgi:ATP-dependent DNA helicase RecG